jgi:hypothetical protein
MSTNKLFLSNLLLFCTFVMLRYVIVWCVHTLNLLKRTMKMLKHLLLKIFAEDNFFGPVSSNFIRPGRLSDSGASDDITMDSTAFSMHFQSLARSDSGGGGDLKTPTMTRAHRLLAFEDSATTPSNTATPTDSASFMVLTKAKKPVLPVDKVSSGGVGGGKDSNDMSIVGENPRSYDYGRISPRLDALLAEGSNILNSISIDSKCLMGSEDMHEMSAEAVSLPSTKTSEASGGSTAIPVDQISHDHQIQTPKQLTEVSTECFFF